MVSGLPAPALVLLTVPEGSPRHCSSESPSPHISGGRARRLCCSSRCHLCGVRTSPHRAVFPVNVPCSGLTSCACQHAGPAPSPRPTDTASRGEGPRLQMATQALNQQQSQHPATIWPRGGYFWLSQLGSGCYWHLVGRGQGSAKHPSGHRITSFPQRISPPKVSVVSELRNPGPAIKWSSVVRKAGRHLRR